MQWLEWVLLRQVQVVAVAYGLVVSVPVEQEPEELVASVLAAVAAGLA